MIYAELVYFDGAHFAHIVRFKDHLRLQKIEKVASAAARASAISRSPPPPPRDGWV
jgi:hypothetical protein